MSETKREYAVNYRKPPLHTRFKKGQSGTPRGRAKKNLPALLVAALNEPGNALHILARRRSRSRSAGASGSRPHTASTTRKLPSITP
jgi:Family of unknown function (DUF5681)